MGRENFYTLLKLKPFENNNDTISAAIEKNLQLWKDNMNKGVGRAKWEGYLALEPEIRRVMLDPYLRKVEAEALKDAKWVDEVAKPIETSLSEVSSKLFSIYDFLSRDSNGNDSECSYVPHDPLYVLKERASSLSEEYRQKNKSDEQKLSGKCLALLENDENKQRYDRYIVQKITSEITGYIDRFQQGNVLDNSSYKTILKANAKGWFRAEHVKEVIDNYCCEKGYQIERSDVPNTAPQQGQSQTYGTGSEYYSGSYGQPQQHYAGYMPKEEDFVYVKQFSFIDKRKMYFGIYEKALEKIDAMTRLAFGDTAKKMEPEKKFFGVYESIKERLVELAVFYNRNDLAEVIPMGNPLGIALKDAFRFSGPSSSKIIEQVFEALIDEHNARVDAYVRRR